MNFLEKRIVQDGVVKAGNVLKVDSFLNHQMDIALMEEIGRQGMIPYSCRHTFITRAIRAGMELPVLEAIVGHVDRETTKIYTHLHADDLVDAVQAIKDRQLAVSNKSATRSELISAEAQKSS